MGRYLSRTAGQSGQSSTIPAPDDTNPVTKRAAVAMQYMLTKGQNSSKVGVMRVVGKICAEAIEDASEVPPAIAEFYMKQLSAMMYWVATGDNPAALNMPLPEDFNVE
jgi:hypothetical protein